MEPSDEALILACRRGDAAAWEALVARYQRLVYAIPRRSGLDADLAGEVFQQVFATLVEKLDSIEQPERIGAWLVTTARRFSWRLSRSLVREQAVAAPVLDDDEETSNANDIADTAPLPDEVVQRLEEQHRVRVAVDALDERCRRLLTLLFYRPDTPSYTEIAAALGISEGSIGPTRARCLQKLRNLLEGETFDVRLGRKSALLE